MSDPITHAVVDANVLSAFVAPTSTDSANVRKRSAVLLEAALQSNWPCLRLYTSASCVGEALCVLDKYRHCLWHGALKGNRSRRLTADQYAAARKQLSETIQKRRIEQLGQEPNHVLLAGLVSPVNFHFEIPRKSAGGSGSGGRRPMSATDCLLAGLSIHLASRLGNERVVLVTDDHRLVDVMEKCRHLTEQDAEKLGLPEVAEQAGLKWSRDLYPECLNIRRARKAQLRDVFGGWPLPTSPLTYKDRRQLAGDEQQKLVEKWLEVGKERRVTNPDILPYSAALADIGVRFAVETSVYMDHDNVFRLLLALRKQGALPRAGAQDSREPESLPLFDKQEA